MQRGIFSVIEYERDFSVEPKMAQISYYASKMNVRKRQLVADINYDTGIITQKGRMQLMLGDIKVTADIQNVSNLFKSIVSSKVTGETAMKPKYTGEGSVILEPSFRYILLEDLAEWTDGLIIEDGMFLACCDTAEIHVEPRKTLSSAAFGGEGLFNSKITGEGIVALESPVPRSELIEINIMDDVIKIDGNMALAWSAGLEFTVERTTSSLVGSVAVGEGLVNVYRGTGKVLVAPVQSNKEIPSPGNNK